MGVVPVDPFIRKIGTKGDFMLREYRGDRCLCRGSYEAQKADDMYDVSTTVITEEQARQFARDGVRIDATTTGR